MRKLSKDSLKERDELCSKLREARSILDDAVAGFNAAKTAKWDKVEAAQEAYNAVLADAQSWKESVASDIQFYMDDRSETWQESEKAQEYEQWRSEFEHDLEEAALDEPDDLDFDIEDAAESLEQLPEEVG